MSLRFGTDGVRGVANVDLTGELVTALGRAVGRVLAPKVPFLIGRDTRRSGTLLEASLTAGLCAEGVDVQSAGVLPTPGLAHLAAALGAPAAMISASHNPFPDNGIKLFAAGGHKIADELESRIEDELLAIVEHGAGSVAVSGADVGVASRIAGSVDRYSVHLISSLEGRRLDGLKVVLDCGNGAAYGTAGRVARELGLDVTLLNVSPDGVNINENCGSTHPAALQRSVRELGADVGFAFDGDADRVIAVDEHGELVDGDHLMLILALDLLGRGRLKGNAIAVTVMSNLGLRRALEQHGITMFETAVGDRNVLEAIGKHGLSVGGEQSGHVILADLATTGDGTLTALAVLDVMARSSASMSELASAMQVFPQVLVNVRVQDRSGLEGSVAVGAAVQSAEAELGDEGRVLVRSSGTEPLVRVMVEADTPERARRIADELAAVVESACR